MVYECPLLRILSIFEEIVVLIIGWLPDLPSVKKRWLNEKSSTGAFGRKSIRKILFWVWKSSPTERKDWTALYIWFRGNFHIKKSPEVPFIDNYMEYLGCTFFVADELWYKIINYRYFGPFLIWKFTQNQICRAVKSLALNAFRSAGL